MTAGLGLWLAPTMGVDGLALALSISTCAQLLAYVIVLQGTVEGGLGLGGLIADVGRMMAATMPAVGLAWLCMSPGDWSLGPTFQNAGIFIGSMSLGAVVYAIGATILGIGELRSVVKRVASRLR